MSRSYTVRVSVAMQARRARHVQTVGGLAQLRSLHTIFGAVQRKMSCTQVPE